MAKRGENIYKRKDNRWEGRFKCGVTATRKTAYKSVYARTYSQCREKLKRAQSAYLMQPVVPTTELAHKIVFGMLARQWLVDIKPTVKESTFAVYSYIVTHYLKALERTRAESISENMVKSFFAMLLRGSEKQGRRALSVRTVGSILTVFKAIYNYAERRHGCKNVAQAVKLPRQKAPQEKVLTETDWKRLTKCLKTDKSEIALAVAISLYTGMRLGEICALRGEDIRLDERVIQVKRSVQRVRCSEMGQRTKLLVQSPKSEYSERKIPIPEVLLERLTEKTIRQKEKKYLFSVDGKSALEPRTLQYRFQKFLEQTKIAAINFHALRHSFATRCVERNVDLKTISEILGHGSVKITLDRYVHSSLEFKRRQINRIGEAI